MLLARRFDGAVAGEREQFCFSPFRHVLTKKLPPGLVQLGCHTLRHEVGHRTTSRSLIIPCAPPRLHPRKCGTLTPPVRLRSDGISAQRRYRTLLPHAASDETGHQAARRPKPPDSRTAQERLALKRDRSGGFNLAVRARRTTWCSGAEEMGAPKRQEPQTESGAKRPEPLPPNPDHHPPDHQPAPRPAPPARRHRRARRIHYVPFTQSRKAIT